MEWENLRFFLHDIQVLKATKTLEAHTVLQRFIYRSLEVGMCDEVHSLPKKT